MIIVIYHTNQQKMLTHYFHSFDFKKLKKNLFKVKAIVIKKTPAFFILHVTNVHPLYLNISPLEVHPPVKQKIFHLPLFLKIFMPPLKKGGGFTL